MQHTSSLGGASRSNEIHGANEVRRGAESGAVAAEMANNLNHDADDDDADGGGGETRDGWSDKRCQLTILILAFG